MNESDRNDVFAAQTENVRVLEQAWKHINKTINFAYSSDDFSSAEIHTKLLAQVYCAFAEAVFSKIIHTPYGLTLDELDQVKATGRNNIVAAWKKCVELSLQSVQGKNSGHVANARQKINELIDRYIHDPSLIRNKVAHGQWKIALNRENSKINQPITAQLQSINVITLYRYKDAFQSLYRIVEDTIESPNKAHHRDYWGHITEFERSQKKMETWTIENKVASLKQKKERARANNGDIYGYLSKSKPSET